MFRSNDWIIFFIYKPCAPPTIRAISYNVVAAGRQETHRDTPRANQGLRAVAVAQDLARRPGGSVEEALHLVKARKIARKVKRVVRAGASAARAAMNKNTAVLTIVPRVTKIRLRTAGAAIMTRGQRRKEKQDRAELHQRRTRTLILGPCMQTTHRSRISSDLHGPLSFTRKGARI